MPIDYKDYPEDWEVISLRIRKERANDHCEQCGVLNGAMYFRDIDGTIRVRNEASESTEAYVAMIGSRLVKVVLTVAHLGAPKDDGSPGSKHDKHDVRDCNLKALCQRCHLKLDLNDHITNRKNGRNWRRDQTVLPI